jgi:translation initiation factor IF-2
LLELQCEKKNMDAVSKGKEAGMRVEGIQDVQEGDLVEIFRLELHKKKIGE